MAERGIANSSPLIFLGAANRLELLQLAGDEIVVPEPVYREITVDQRGSKLGRSLSSLSWLKVIAPVPNPASVLAWDLGAGEAAVLSWAMANPGAVAIIDDLAGRKCARAHNIPLRGTLGLVLAARRKGQISSARSVLRDLRAAGMYLSDGLLAKALAEVGE